MHDRAPAGYGYGLGLSAAAAEDGLSSSTPDGSRSALGLDILPVRTQCKSSLIPASAEQYSHCLLSTPPDLAALSLASGPPPSAPALSSSPPSPVRTSAAQPPGFGQDDADFVARPSWKFREPSPLIPNLPNSAPVSPLVRHHVEPVQLPPLQKVQPTVQQQGVHTSGSATGLAGPDSQRPSPEKSTVAIPPDSDDEEEDILSTIGSTPTRSTVSQASVSPAGSRFSLSASVRRPPGSTASEDNMTSHALGDKVPKHIFDDSFSFGRPGLSARLHTDPTGANLPRRASSGRVSFASDHSVSSVRHDESLDRSRSPQRRGSVMPLVRALGRRKSTSPSGGPAASEGENGPRGHLRFTSLLAAIARGYNKQRTEPQSSLASAGEVFRPPSILVLSRSRSRSRDPSPQELSEAIRKAPKLKKAYGVLQVSPELDRSPVIDALPYAMKGEAKAARVLGVAATEENARFSPHYTAEDTSHLPRFPAKQEQILDLAL